nr:hypothetical protein [Marinicella sp. W31]MDC2878329.1 hypothetical protein [Marinicella sp. W31]
MQADIDGEIANRQAVSGSKNRVYEDERHERSGYDFAELGSDWRLIRSIIDGVVTHSGPHEIGKLNGITFRTDGRYERSGYAAVLLGSDDTLIAGAQKKEDAEAAVDLSLPVPLNFAGRYERCGYAAVWIGSDYRYIIGNEPEVSVAVAEDDAVPIAYIDDDGGEAAVFIEAPASGQRKRLSSAGSDASGLQYDGRGHVLWTAPDNAIGAPGGQYYSGLSAPEEHAVRPVRKLACWGDSITAQGWMSYLAAAGTTNTFYNFGRSADTSLAIVSRMGALKNYYSVDGGAIPASGSVLLTRSGPGDPLRKYAGVNASVQGYLSGIWGTLSSIGGVVSFTRASAGLTITGSTAEFKWGYSATADNDPADETMLITAAPEMTHIVMMGRNDAAEIDDIFRHYEAAFDWMQTLTRRFVFAPYFPTRSETSTSSAWMTRARLVDKMLVRWPNNTLDLLPLLLAAYDPETPQDVTDVANQVPPSTLMQGDGIHPNDAGKAVVATAFDNFITTKGTLA